MVPKEYYVVNNGTWTVKEGAVAYVNIGTLTGPYRVAKDFGFATLEEAFAAAGDGNTITLLKDVTLTETLVNTKTVTLDLNGKTISMVDNASVAASRQMILNKGNLTITGEGKISYEYVVPCLLLRAELLRT